MPNGIEQKQVSMGTRLEIVHHIVQSYTLSSSKVMEVSLVNMCMKKGQELTGPTEFQFHFRS